MKIENINKFFRKIGEWQIKHRLMLLGIVFVFLVVGIAGLSHVTVINDREQWFSDADAIEIATEKFEQQFGNNDNIMLLIEAEDVFDERVVLTIKDIGDELLEKVPYADEVISLAELEISVGTQDGMQIINPFADGIPSDKKKMEEIRSLVLSQKSVANKLVSKDSKETLLLLSLYEYPPQDEWTKETTKDPMFQAGEAAMDVVTDPKWQSELYSIKAAGLPYTETEERDFINTEMPFRIMLILVTMTVLLALTLRSFWGVVIPIFTALSGLVIVFGFMGWLGFGINSNMMMLPLVLGLSLSVAYSVHLTNAFRHSFRLSGLRKDSAIVAVEKTGWPLFFAAITTIGSLISFLTAGVIAISWTGLTSATVVAASFLLALILIPILFSFGKDKTEEKKQKHSQEEKILLALGRFIIQKKKATIIFFAIISLVLLPGVFKVKVNVDVFEMMGLKIPYINRVYQISQSQLGSYVSYNVTIDYDEPDAIKDPIVMKKFDSLVKTVSGFNLTKKTTDNASVFSVVDILKELNQTLHNNDPHYYNIPESKEMISQLLFLYEISGGTKLFNWIDEDYSMLRLQVQLERYNTQEVLKDMSEIRRIAAEQFPNAKVSLIGDAMQLAEMNGQIVWGELKSVFSALVLISVLLIFVFGSIKIGLIGMIPNIAPMLVIGGYMGYLEYELSMMTMTILPMLLGIAVDDTIHFINSIKYEFEKTANYQEAILIAFRSVGTALAITTIILSFSFAVFVFSPMVAMSRVGLLVVLGLLSALVADYFVAPALILYTKPFGETKQKGK